MLARGCRAGSCSCELANLCCPQAEGTRHPLLASQGQSAAACARIFLVLQRAHEQLRTGCTVTLRDLYYQLKPTSTLFRSTADVASAINAAAALLEVPRSALGIACGTKGAVAGRLHIQQQDGSWTDCATSLLSGFPIPGNPVEIAAARTNTDARSALQLTGCWLGQVPGLRLCTGAGAWLLWKRRQSLPGWWVTLRCRLHGRRQPSAASSAG